MVGFVPPGPAVRRCTRPPSDRPRRRPCPPPARWAPRPPTPPRPPIPRSPATGLTKRFRSGQIAVNGVDLAVPHGSVYGFLGPNGSGKTTTIRLLLGLIRATSGSHRLLGAAMPDSAADVLPRIGAMVEGPAFHPYLSGRDNLRRLDAADRTVDPATAGARIDEALDRVGLRAAASSATASSPWACVSDSRSPPPCCAPVTC